MWAANLYSQRTTNQNSLPNSTKITDRIPEFTPHTEENYKLCDYVMKHQV